MKTLSKTSKTKQASALEQARKEWDSPEVVAVRKAISIVQIAEDTIWMLANGLDRNSEVAKALKEASDSLGDILEGGNGSGICDPAERLDRFLPTDPIGLEALAAAAV